MKGHAVILASHPQTPVIVPEWQRMTGEELNNRGLTLYPRGDPSG